MTEKFYIDDYLNKNQANILESLEKDKDNKDMDKNVLSQFLSHEKKNDNRMKVIQTLKEMIVGKKSTIETKVKTDEKSKSIKSKGGTKMQYGMLTDKAPFKGGTSIPAEVGGGSIYVGRFSQLTEEAVAHLKKQFGEDQIEIISEAEHKKRLEKQNKDIEQLKKENKA